MGQTAGLHRRRLLARQRLEAALLPNLAAQFPNRTGYWVAKITWNMERDGRHTEELGQLGWTVLRFWESDVLKDVEGIADQVVRALESARTG